VSIPQKRKVEHTMSTPIENSRRHGPFDPRFLPRPDRVRTMSTNGSIDSAKEAERLEEERRATFAEAGVQAWETEGGAVTKAA
jgi:hypothetical protein